MELINLGRAAWVALVTVSAYAAVFIRRIVLGQSHPLDWPVDLEMVAAGFKVGIKWGNLATLRLMLGFMAQPWIHFGLRIEPIQPPGCQPAYWLSLKTSSSSADSDSEHSSSSGGHPGSSQQPDVVLCYVHGGAFVAGHPLMCVMTFERWIKALARQGITCKVLCIQYPLAPERPFPAAVASTAAIFAWVGQQYPADCGTTVIAVGDSAGGNIVPTSLAALRDYMQRQQQHPKPAQLPTQQQQQEESEEQPATHSTTEASKVSSAGGASGSKPMHADSAVIAPAGEAEHAVATSSSGHGAALTAAIEAHLFADLHNRLTVMAAKTSSSASNGASSSASASATAALLSAVRMPSSIILVSPATDISPTACFRTRKPPHMASAAASSSCDAPAAAKESAALPPCSNTSNGSGRNPSSSNGNGSSSNRRPHYDYLPEDLESGGMGSYAEHHEQLCGVYASPVHLPSVEGLCAGRWLVLSGGVELLHPDIERFAKKLQRSLGEPRVMFHVEPSLPHSWAILPNPSMATRQEVVVRFIAAEHAATVAAAGQPAAAHSAADSVGLVCCG